MRDRPLSRRYRYHRQRYVARVVLKASPDRGKAAFRFYAETYKIASLMFLSGKPGGVLNTVCTTQGGGVIFRHRKQAVNVRRARLVAAVWRTWQRVHVNGCLCSIATVLPDGTLFPGGVDDCPIHGFGGES